MVMVDRYIFLIYQLSTINYQLNLGGIYMPNIGFPELMIILTIALLVFGPRKLPELGRSIGQAIKEFKKAGREIQHDIKESIEEEEVSKSKTDSVKREGEKV
jgi:sec-independent protein translocase protein TatA